MSAWSMLVYVSATVVYLAVAATIWGFIREVRPQRSKLANSRVPPQTPNFTDRIND